MIGSDEGTKLVSTDSKMFGTILGNVNGIVLGLDVGTEMGSLDGSFARLLIHFLKLLSSQPKMNINYRNCGN